MLELLASLVYGVALVVYTANPRVVPQACPKPIVLAVPVVFHVLFTVFGFAKGIYAQIPILAVVGILMLVSGLGVHPLPWFAHRAGN